MKLLQSIMLLLLASYARAQDIHWIEGVIQDSASQKPLTGVMITDFKTNYTAISDSIGHFSLRGNTGDTISVSHLNYTPLSQTVPDSSAPLIINLERSSNTLEQVIVNTGYQSLPAERSTGSFTHLDNNALHLQRGTYILDRLNGIANGVLFPTNKTNTPALLVRGQGSLIGSKSPLIVVDNFPYEGDINNINPNDVASVTILKDAAAASIWGTRAGNGVIVITTKKGRFGHQPTLELNANIIASAKPDLSYYPQMNSSDYIDVEQMLFDAGAYNDYDDLYPLFGYYPALPPVVELLLAEKKGTISAGQAQQQIDAYRNHDVRDDYKKYLYRGKLNQQYALSLDGGSNNLSYLFSLGYDNNISGLDAIDRRLTLRLNNSFRPTKNLEVTTTFVYTGGQQQSGRPAYNSIRVYGAAVPYLQLADEKGQPLPLAIDYRKAYTDTAGNGYLQDWNYYPLTDYLHNTTQSNTNDILGDIGLRYSLGKEFVAEMKYHYEKQQSDDNNLADKESYAARSLTNYFTQLDQHTGYIYYAVPPGGILNTTANTMENQDGRLQLNYHHDQGIHDLNIIAGGELREIYTKITTNTLYGYDDATLQSAAVDFVNPYPDYVDGSPSYINNGFSLTELRDRYISVYGNAGYTLRQRYTLTLSGRKDASNLFGVNTNDKWKPLWSAGAGWTPSKEGFYKLQWLPYLKLRGTYGFSGNADQTRSAVTTFFLTDGAPLTNLPYAIVNRYANPDLRWEKTRTINLGLDFALKNDIINGSIEYYFKRGTDLFGSAPIDYTAGLGRNIIVTNNAATAGHGADIQLQTKTFGHMLQFKVGMIFNYYSDQITRLYNAAQSAYSFVQNGTLTGNIEGKPLFSVISYRWAGLDPLTGDPQGYLDSKISTDYAAITGNTNGLRSLEYNGPALPVYSGALTPAISWRQLSLTANITCKMGYYFRQSSINYSDLFASGNGHADYARRWQKAGDEKNTNVPSMQYPADPDRDNFYLNSSATVHRADNIRLQFVNLSYSLNNTNIKLPFHSLTTYLNITNPGIIWKAYKSNIDPDYGDSFPPLTTCTLGVTARF